MTRTLKSLYIANFKCFRELHVDFGGLTVLCGFNGAGKSTVIQPALLLAQTYGKNKATNFGEISDWPLNGDLIQLGTAEELLKEKSRGKNINFKFELSEGKPISFNFKTGHAEPSLKVSNSKNPLSPLKTQSTHQVFQQLSQLTYLNLNGISVQDSFPNPKETEYPVVNVGTDGRFANYWYNKQATAKVDKTRCCPREESSVFRKQMDAWLRELTFAVETHVFESGDSEYALKFKFDGKDCWQGPTNAGLGLSVIFPMLVALLNAREGDLLIFDNPEFHLHPKAQSMLGQAFAIFASTGVQIIIETNSEHILNGIRLGVKKGTLHQNEIRILFFSGANNKNHGVISPNIARNGRIDHWPDGFFDQLERNLLELLSPTNESTSE